jgi:signal transduction histidine kinase
MHGEQAPPGTDAAAALPTIRRLLVRLVLFVYLPALVAVMAMVALETRNRLDAAKESLLERTQLVSRSMRLRIDGIQSHLERLAQEIPADDGDWRAFDDDARRTAVAADLDAIILHRPDGSQVINTHLPWGAPLPRHTPQELMPATKTGRRSVIGLTPGPLSGRLLVAASLPVVRQGRLVYEITGAFNAASLQDLLAQTPPQWTAAIVDARGVTVARAPAPESYVGRMVTDELRQHALGSEQGVYRMKSLDGVAAFTAFLTPPSVGWTVVTSVPRNVLYAPVYLHAAWLAIGAAVLLAVALWVAAELAASIVRTVEALAAEAEGWDGSLMGALAFREAERLHRRLRSNARKLADARRELERIDAQYQRRLIKQTHRHQARIASDLHDDVGSSLAGITLLLEHLRPTIDPPAGPALDHILQQVTRTAQRVRAISRGLLPAGEQQGGLPAAIEQLVADLFGAGEVRCDFHWRGDFGEVPAEGATHLYRIAQEALANSVRHGGAKRLRIMLAAVHGRCRLTLDDDGSGFAGDPGAALQQGAGLKFMRARTLAVDGEIDFGRSPLGGARVRVTWPHPLQHMDSQPALP